jgi:hypothetical protein
MARVSDSVKQKSRSYRARALSVPIESPVGAITELVEGDVYHWGSLMAAALFGCLKCAGARLP